MIGLVSNYSRFYGDYLPCRQVGCFGSHIKDFMVIIAVGSTFFHSEQRS